MARVHWTLSSHGDPMAHPWIPKDLYLLALATTHCCCVGRKGMVHIAKATTADLLISEAIRLQLDGSISYGRGELLGTPMAGT